MHHLLKVFIGSVLILAGFCPVLAQNYWIRSSGGVGYEDVVCADHHLVTGSVVAGHFNFPFSIGVYPFVSAGLSDAFIICHNDTGGIRWARPIGGSGDDRATALKIAGTGEVYVAGTFTQNFQVGLTLLTCSGQKDMFIVKLSPAGALLSAWSYGGVGNEEPGDIEIDLNGNIIVTGTFTGQSNFGGQSVISTINPVTQTYGSDPFIASISPSGSVNWLKKGGSSFNDTGVEVEVDGQGNVYAAGQCSDTIQFGQTYPNAAYNAIWILKTDQSGTDLWCRTIAGSSKSILRGMEVLSNGDLYVGGEAGNGCLFSGPVSSVLNTPYPNAAFLASYSSSGNIVWITHEGSSSNLSVSCISVEPNGKVWMAGTFNCMFSSMSTAYGQGRFRSTGYEDIWLAAYAMNGTRLFAQQFGGHGEERVVAMADAGGVPFLAGRYDRRVIIPSNPFFKQYDGFQDLYGVTSGTVCNDPWHGKFQKRDVLSGTDFFYGTCVDVQRGVYDFFGRQIVDCTFPAIPLCIGTGGDAECKGDTITACGQVSLSGATNTNAGPAGDTLTTAGPFFHYLWSNGSTAATISVPFDGMFTVTVTSEDGCFTGTASAYADVLPAPSIPYISDNFNVNINAFYPLPVRTCVPDTFILTASNTGGNTYTWSTQNGIANANGPYTYVATIADSFNVDLTVTNSFGCIATNSVFIAADSLFPVVVPMIVSSDPDTLTACAGSSVSLYVVDSLVDPLGEFPCKLSGFAINWTSVPSANLFTGCGGQMVSVQVLNQGIYTLTCSMIRSSLCGGIDSFQLTKSVYVSFAPSPVVNAGISGANSTDIICPGEIKMLTASGGYFYSWSGPGVQMPYNDSVLVVSDPGQYCVIVTDSTDLGCIGSSMSCVTLTGPAPPSIVASTELICPGDSISITASGGVHYDWYGPSGPLQDTTAVIQTAVPGFYYVYVQDTSGCTLVSNAVELEQYSTPALFAQPVPVICNGVPITLQVSSNTGSVLNWLPPLTGSNPQQLISSPGIYQCNVTSCNITSLASIQVAAENIQAGVTPSGNISICENDTVQLTANGSYPVYQWIPGNENGNQLTVTTAGSYAVFVISAAGCMDTSSYVQVTEIPAPPAPSVLVNDSLCEGQDIVLSAGAVSGSFSWTGPGGFASTQLNPVISNAQLSDNGGYTASQFDGQCYGDTTVYIHIFALPHPLIDPDGDWCKEEMVVLKDLSSTPGSYLWSLPDGSIVADSVLQIGPLSASDNGWYTLVKAENGCVGYDSVLVTVNDCQLTMPNVFTPNGDQVNDLFEAVNGSAIIRSISILNRWGSEVYSGTSGRWDGRSDEGKELPAGTYFYIVKLDDGTEASGTVLLVR